MSTARDISPHRRREAGFSLIELLAAITLFSLIVVGFVFARNESIEQAGVANDTRILRYLVAYQIGELRLGFDSSRNEIETGDQGGEFSHLGPQYADYTWSARIEEVVAAGTSSDEDDIPSLFGTEDEEDTDTEAEKGEPVTVYRITLTVIPPTGEESEGLSLVTFRPTPRKAEGEGEGSGG